MRRAATWAGKHAPGSLSPARQQGGPCCSITCNRKGCCTSTLSEVQRHRDVAPCPEGQIFSSRAFRSAQWAGIPGHRTTCIMWATIMTTDSAVCPLS